MEGRPSGGGYISLFQPISCQHPKVWVCCAGVSWPWPPRPSSSLHCMVPAMFSTAVGFVRPGCLAMFIMAASVSYGKRQAGEESNFFSVFDPLCPLPPKYLIIRHFSQSGCFLLTQSQPRWPHKHLSSLSQSLFGWEMGIAM